jgi:hypothetical protein
MKALLLGMTLLFTSMGSAETLIGKLYAGQDQILKEAVVRIESGKPVDAVLLVATNEMLKLTVQIHSEILALQRDDVGNLIEKTVNLNHSLFEKGLSYLPKKYSTNRSEISSDLKIRESSGGALAIAGGVMDWACSGQRGDVNQLACAFSYGGALAGLAMVVTSPFTLPARGIDKINLELNAEIITVFPDEYMRTKYYLN